MGQQAGTHSEFCARPPSCLAQQSDIAFSSDTEVWKIFIGEARELQSRLREQLAQIRAESGVFMRLMYKNKNQHRRSLYYRRLSEIKRDLSILNTSGLNATVENFAELFHNEGLNVTADPQSKPTDLADGKEALCTLLGVARLLDRIDAPILAGSLQIAGLLGQSFFIPFALTMFSCLARFRVLFIQVLFEVVTAYNLLAAVRQRQQKVPATICLPSELVCQWEGERLCLIEKNNVGFLGKEKADCEMLPTQPPVWFVDDRTGVMSELGCPAIAEGSSGERLSSSLKASPHTHEMKHLIGPGLDTVDVDTSDSKNVNDHDVCKLEYSKTASQEEDVSASGAVTYPLEAQTATSFESVQTEKVSAEQGPDFLARNLTLRRDRGPAQQKNVAYISVITCSGRGQTHDGKDNDYGSISLSQNIVDSDYRRRNVAVVHDPLVEHLGNIKSGAALKELEPVPKVSADLLHKQSIMSSDPIVRYADGCVAPICPEVQNFTTGSLQNTPPASKEIAAYDANFCWEAHGEVNIEPKPDVEDLQASTQVQRDFTGSNLSLALPCKTSVVGPHLAEDESARGPQPVEVEGGPGPLQFETNGESEKSLSVTIVHVEEQEGPPDGQNNSLVKSLTGNLVEPRVSNFEIDTLATVTRNARKTTAPGLTIKRSFSKEAVSKNVGISTAVSQKPRVDLKRSVALVSGGSAEWKRRKKYKEGVKLIQDKEVPMSCKERQKDAGESGAKRQHDETKGILRRDSKQGKADDIFAMLLEGAR